MATCATQTSDNFLRVLQAVQYVVCKAVPSLDESIRTWHSNQIRRNRLLPCSQPHLCPKTGKPKHLSKFQRLVSRKDSVSSCKNCVRWAKAVKDAFYSPPTKENSTNIAWEHLNPTRLFHSYIEICNACVLHELSLQPSPTTLQNFDIEGILQIMLHFREFHDCNYSADRQDPYSNIMQVIRAENLKL